jgi:hypothetical protein
MQVGVKHNGQPRLKGCPQLNDRLTLRRLKHFV